MYNRNSKKFRMITAILVIVLIGAMVLTMILSLLL